MTVRTDTLWEQFLKPIVSHFLDQEQMKELADKIDWEQERDRVANPTLEYPNYYQSQNFHGVLNGYLNKDAAITYDAITRYFVPPHETWVREDAVNCVQGQPQRILDLGCGTGSTTILLQQAFPNAEVIGLDLSPYMLLVAEDKAQNLPIQWCHRKAEDTQLQAETFDLVTASLLFHETPVSISQAILREAFRLLKGGGQFLLLDGNQETLRNADWLTNIFEEPYIQEYAQGNVETWLENAGFIACETHFVWGLHQVNIGYKPQPVSKPSAVIIEENEDDITATAPT
ncbi:MAG: methyltransferase domain-containing protein [Halothece sp. Uz-M2-17]|nr:methyltransferase domain-containing protein [Halothece sp. Uz-M2-17]